MIRKRSLTKEWIIGKHKEIKADPILIEKVIFACELLGLLVEYKMDFIFKGGTALLLLIPELKRLSIDLDVITEDNIRKLEEIFNTIVKKGLFHRCDEDERTTEHNIPKRHFRFYYNSSYQKKESYVLLDILFAKSPFSNTISIPVNLPLFEIEKEVEVVIPTVNALAGDKLTAFAPNTIGVPYGKGKSMEIIKQLFDIGILFERINDMKEINESYKNAAKNESSYRKQKITYKKFLDDTINTSFLLSELGFSGAAENEKTKELRDGIKRVKSHVVGGKYSLLDAKVDASKVAFLAYLIKENKLNIKIDETRIKRKNVKIVKDISLTGDYNILNKLKSISPESLYLWAITSGVIGF